MRVYAWTTVSIALLAGCHPSASVATTLPIANLQSYGTVGLRVASQTQPRQTGALEADVLGRLRQQCGFTQIGRMNGAPVDVVIDLNITRMARGGDSRFIQNANEATIDTLLVLTDGHSGELLGTSRIHGSSSAIQTSGVQPEREAIDVVAQTVANVLAKSGCSGPRIARVEPPEPAPTPGPNPTSASPTGNPDGTVQLAGTEPHRAEAEALNQQGTEKLQGADMAGALVAFQQANALTPDPKYVFNACLTLESEQQWDAAISACKQAKGMSPQPRLAQKIDHRLDLLAQHQ